MVTEANNNTGTENTCPCQSGGFVGSRMVHANHYYTDEQKKALAADGLTWNFFLDICTGCNAVIGIAG